MASSNNNTHIHISHLTKQTMINGACSKRHALLRSQELWDLVEEGYDEPESTRKEAAMKNTNDGLYENLERRIIKPHLQSIKGLME